MTPPDTLLTEQELADRWRVSRSTIRAWRRERRGPAFIRLGRTQQGRIMYRLTDVLLYEDRLRQEVKE